MGYVCLGNGGRYRPWTQQTTLRPAPGRYVLKPLQSLRPHLKSKNNIRNLIPHYRLARSPVCSRSAPVSSAPLWLLPPPLLPILDGVCTCWAWALLEQSVLSVGDQLAIFTYRNYSHFFSRRKPLSPIFQETHHHTLGCEQPK